jgi:hypothetical protein
MRIWDAGSRGSGTAPGPGPAARSYPRRSGATRPGNRDRSCPRCRRRPRSAAGASAWHHGCRGACEPAPHGLQVRSRPAPSRCTLPLARHLPIFQAQQHLIFRQRLCPPAKPMSLQFPDDLTQPLALAPLGEQHRFQRLGIVRQGVAHTQFRAYSPPSGDASDALDSLRRSAANS